MDDPELKWLLHNQSAMDARLARVEDSMVFRTLRAVGTFYQTTFRGDAKSSASDYRAWRVRNIFGHVVPSGGHVVPSGGPLISIGGAGDLDSLREQTYTNWTLDQDAGEYRAELTAGVKLAPDTLARGVAAMQGSQPGLVYFDHEIVDGSDEPLRPVFKPDWSPVLAESCDYTGPFALTSRERREGVVHVPHVSYATRFAPRLRRPEAVELSAHPLVSVLICTRNAKLLTRCLSTLRANTRYTNFETIVIHHTGSADDAEIEKITREQGLVRVAYSEPFNFSSMNNLGARAARGGLLLFLNDDVEPVDAGWLQRMIGWLERPEIGAVGAKLIFPNAAIQHAGIATWVMDGAGHPGRNMSSSEYWPWLNCTREVTAVTGACLLVRRADFEAIEGFDPQFPMNFNDVDLCLRLRSRGLSVIVDAGAVLQHDESRTRVRGVQFEERRRFFLRWADRVQKVDPLYSPSLAQNNENLSLRG